ncbi:hypothetical protein GPUN_2613 [Glaciecola punicea ACAM 611]|uniref:Uncharacterized protein n=1 Tax=Glaciecola punicea ACAM 611 TaxID=1121923 RepID=H5TEK1_9ALTE|nr:hypothetical protein GPUN_2613 [Glaciecola punicea ACAM 611]
MKKRFSKLQVDSNTTQCTFITALYIYSYVVNFNQKGN